MILRVINHEVRETAIIAFQCEIEIYDVFNQRITTKRVRKEHLYIAPGCYFDVPLFVSRRAYKGKVVSRMTAFEDGEVTQAYAMYYVLGDSYQTKTVGEGCNSLDKNRTNKPVKNSENDGCLAVVVVGVLGFILFYLVDIFL